MFRGFFPWVGARVSLACLSLLTSVSSVAKQMIYMPPSTWQSRFDCHLPGKQVQWVKFSCIWDMANPYIPNQSPRPSHSPVLKFLLKKERRLSERCNNSVSAKEREEAQVRDATILSQQGHSCRSVSFLDHRWGQRLPRCVIGTLIITGRKHTAFVSQRCRWTVGPSQQVLSCGHITPVPFFCLSATSY